MARLLSRGYPQVFSVKNGPDGPQKKYLNMESESLFPSVLAGGSMLYLGYNEIPSLWRDAVFLCINMN